MEGEGRKKENFVGYGKERRGEGVRKLSGRWKRNEKRMKKMEGEG